MASVLFVYSTVDGQTRRICERLGERVAETGHSVTLFELTVDEQPDPDTADCVVLGGSIRYGKHRPELAAFIDRHRNTLESKPNALFTVNAVARKPQKNAPDTNPYMQKLLHAISFRPQLLDVFAGRIDYPRYGFVDRNVIRFIMWMTGGPTDPNASVEFTDWDRVDAFGQRIAEIASRA